MLIGETKEAMRLRHATVRVSKAKAALGAANQAQRNAETAYYAAYDACGKAREALIEAATAELATA